MKKKGKFEQPRRGTSPDRETPESGVCVPKTKKRRGGKTALIVTCVVVALVLAAAGVGGWWFLDTTRDDGRICANTYFAEVNLSGLTGSQAKDALEEFSHATYTGKSLVVELPDCSLILDPEGTKAQLDTGRIVSDAMAFCRDGNRWENYQARIQAQSTRRDLKLTDYLSFDVQYIRDLLNQTAAKAESRLTQPEITVRGDLPDLERPYSQAVQDPDVVHMAADVRMGTPERTLDTDALWKIIENAYLTNCYDTISFSYQSQEPAFPDLEALHSQYAVEPVDAVRGENGYEIITETLGYGFDPADFRARLESCKPGETMTLEFQFIRPKVTAEDLDREMFGDVLASVDTDHVDNPGRTTNLILACQEIDGLILEPGELFSFNDVVGQRTAEKGYQPAAIFAGGQTVADVGGGICQVASTLYYATLLADLEVVERAEHAFEVPYVPLGMDATIYWGSYDYCFRNNTDYPIRILAGVSDGQVHVVFQGTETKDYYVEMEYEITDGPHDGGTVYRDYPEGNEEGYADGDLIQSGYDGCTVETYSCKYDRETDELISRDYVTWSEYMSREQIIARVS